MRKPVFRSLRPGKAQTGLISYDISDKASIGIILSRQQKNNGADLRLYCSHMPLDRFSQDEAQITTHLCDQE